MILLFGGTAETAPIAARLAAKGFQVWVSMATDIPLDIGANQNISKRVGRLSETQMRRIVQQNPIETIVDATHPYAEKITPLARSVATDAAIPFFRFLRPGVGALTSGMHLAKEHAAAANIAFGFGRPVLLTTGSQNLAPYVDAAHATGIPLIVRVLPALESIAACQKAGIPGENIIAAKGPFSLAENINVIQKYAIGVLVTKDSGKAGGVPQKLEAASINQCDVVLVTRPTYETDWGRISSDIAELADAICELLTSNQ